MNPTQIQQALSDITAETDPTLKHLKLASFDCAKKLLAAALLGEIETDWAEVKRLAQNHAYKNWNDVKELVYEQAHALQVRSPYHSDE